MKESKQIREYEEMIAGEMLKMAEPFSSFSGFFVIWKDAGESRRYALTVSMPGALDLFGRICKTSPVEVWKVRQGTITRKVAG